MMKYEEIKEVYQTTETDEVNKKLSAGWVLLGKPLQSKIRTADIEQQQPLYILCRY